MTMNTETISVTEVLRCETSQQTLSVLLWFWESSLKCEAFRFIQAVSVLD